MTRSPRIWLVDIRSEIAGIRDLTKDATANEFAQSWAMKRAVEHALLPAETKAAHPEVAWQKIHGLGNLLRHEYRRIDAEVLWSVVTDHLDVLDNVAASLLDRLAKG
jgi:uncharacterized protein with HEPN domain